MPSGDVLISADDNPVRDELLALYESVGWTAYTGDPATLERAVAGSSYLVTARRGGVLIGLARAISDDATICYLQDILVAPQERRTGVGSLLAREILRRYAGVRQKVLLTDDEPGQRAFYDALGYTEIRDFGQASLRAFVRFDG
ncbi:MAG: GNAT family N-acetyltransferase [Streptosporangiaceae bacterium]